MRGALVALFLIAALGGCRELSPKPSGFAREQQLRITAARPSLLSADGQLEIPSRERWIANRDECTDPRSDRDCWNKPLAKSVTRSVAWFHAPGVAPEKSIDFLLSKSLPENFWIPDWVELHVTRDFFGGGDYYEAVTGPADDEAPYTSHYLGFPVCGGMLFVRFVSDADEFASEPRRAARVQEAQGWAKALATDAALRDYCEIGRAHV